ncbi:hypothetical protein EJ997_06905 [Flaviflexus ciconiae]|uniref:Uncharacterized protein n=1 Tax=Flaviflexus ciconiae TaxID=2496867 RepID=A0A3Q9G7L6_9ACTO|nr:hypothetical protein [Flaviflexus ciconiae]AZQ77097.1 hypothetical protein EJ997_06905 [Flaviflexus ciconiae]
MTEWKKMRKPISALLLIVGVALIVVGVGSATWWKPSTTIVATTEAESESGIIVTDPGVLEMVNDTVTVVARAPGTNVEMVVASSSTANIWLGDDPHVRVTGLTNWETLSTEVPENDAAPEDDISVQGSDLFSPDNFLTGDGAAEMHFVVPEGDWSLIAVGEDGTTPQLTITWEREVDTPHAIPLIILGIVIFAAGSALFLFDTQVRSIAKKRAESIQRTERRDRADATETTVIPAIKVDGTEPVAPERDTVREASGGSYGAGILPASPRAEEFRAAELETEEPVIEPVNEDETASDSDGESEVAGNAEAAPHADSNETDELDESGDRDRVAEAELSGESDQAEELAGAETQVDDKDESGESFDQAESVADESGDADADTEEAVSNESDLDDNSDESDSVQDAENHAGADPNEVLSENSPSSHVESVDSEVEESGVSDSEQHDAQRSTDESDNDDERRATSAQWRELWGFGPKE